MVHVEGDGGRKRFRVRLPSTYESVAVILSLACFMKELGPVIQAAALFLLP